MHEVYIHSFLRPDHWDVADIWTASWDSSQPEVKKQARHDWVFHRLEEMHEEGATTFCALNKRTGGIAGFVTLNAPRGTLLRIAVASSARGSGVATALLARAKAFAPDGLTVEIPPDNERAARFFQREGFLPVEGAQKLAWR